MSVSSSRTAELLHLLWLAPRSPEELAGQSGQSLAEVTRSLEALVRAGWPPEGISPASDPLSSELLALLLSPASRFSPARCHVHGVLDSTSDEAARLAKAGATEGTLVVALRQTAGRGRQGRVWHAPPGDNLSFSLLLRPVLEPRAAPQLTLLAAVALWETLHDDLGLEGVTIKWPNDLLLEGRKVAGILTGMTLEGARVGYGVVGVGINVHGAAANFPPELAERVGVLDQGAPRPVPRALLLALFLGRFEAWYERLLGEGFAPLRAAWSACAGTLGRSVRVGTPPEVFQGKALGLDPDGFLLVRREDGRVERVMAGEVELAG